ncbi:flavodoxin domain-containing protein [Paenibacillus donghaensis]|nr:flavodoxin domain-containing protein [Paenibacillus donghaensis]
MKTLIIYKSVHRKNTEQIAKVMAAVLEAELAKVEDVRPEMLGHYDLIGFGSGIYASKVHRKLARFIRRMPVENRNVFIFCTSGSGEFKNQQQLTAQLSAKGCKVVAEYHCSGEFSPLGFNLDKKGHPDPLDLQGARSFAENLRKEAYVC